jgi:hypothetical protein
VGGAESFYQLGNTNGLYTFDSDCIFDKSLLTDSCLSSKRKYVNVGCRVAIESRVLATHAREQAASEDVAAGLSSDAVAHVKNAVDHPVHRKVHLRKATEGV